MRYVAYRQYNFLEPIQEDQDSLPNRLGVAYYVAGEVLCQQRGNDVVASPYRDAASSRKAKTAAEKRY